MEGETREHRDSPDGEPAADDPAFATSLHVRRAREGNQESLTWIVERFSPPLLADAKYRLGAALRTHCDPEDLVSEVWVTALPRLGELPARDGRYTPVLLKFLSTTLFNKVRNLIQKHIQGKPKRERLSSDGDTSSGRPTVDSLPAPAAGVITQIARREAGDLVLKSLESLDPDAREIVILRGIEQHPYDELSAILGATPKALSARYRRALEKLRGQLQGSIYDEMNSD